MLATLPGLEPVMPKRLKCSCLKTKMIANDRAPQKILKEPLENCEVLGLLLRGAGH